MLITAHRHWWKDILKLWRRCTVFSLSFDYIPNYSASKQLNEAWMLWAGSVCNWTMLLDFEHPTALILCRREWVHVRERRLMKEGCSWSSEACLDYRGQQYQNDITAHGLMSPWCHALSSIMSACVCLCFGDCGQRERLFLWEQSSSLLFHHNSICKVNTSGSSASEHLAHSMKAISTKW